MTSSTFTDPGGGSGNLQEEGIIPESTSTATSPAVSPILKSASSSSLPLHSSDAGQLNVFHQSNFTSPVYTMRLNAEPSVLSPTQTHGEMPPSAGYFTFPEQGDGNRDAYISQFQDHFIVWHARGPDLYLQEFSISQDLQESSICINFSPATIVPGTSIFLACSSQSPSQQQMAVDGASGSHTQQPSLHQQLSSYTLEVVVPTQSGINRFSIPLRSEPVDGTVEKLHSSSPRSANVPQLLPQSEAILRKHHHCHNFTSGYVAAKASITLVGDEQYVVAAVCTEDKQLMRVTMQSPLRGKSNDAEEVLHGVGILDRLSLSSFSPVWDMICIADNEEKEPSIPDGIFATALKRLLPKQRSPSDGVATIYSVHQDGKLCVWKSNVGKAVATLPLTEVLVDEPWLLGGKAQHTDVAVKAFRFSRGATEHCQEMMAVVLKLQSASNCMFYLLEFVCSSPSEVKLRFSCMIETESVVDFTCTSSLSDNSQDFTLWAIAKNNDSKEGKEGGVRNGSSLQLHILSFPAVSISANASSSPSINSTSPAWESSEYALLDNGGSSDSHSYSVGGAGAVESTASLSLLHFPSIDLIGTIHESHFTLYHLPQQNGSPPLGVEDREERNGGEERALPNGTEERTLISRNSTMLGSNPATAASAIPPTSENGGEDAGKLRDALEQLCRDAQSSSMEVVDVKRLLEILRGGKVLENGVTEEAPAAPSPPPAKDIVEQVFSVAYSESERALDRATTATWLDEETNLTWFNMAWRATYWWCTECGEDNETRGTECDACGKEGKPNTEAEAKKARAEQELKEKYDAFLVATIPKKKNAVEQFHWELNWRHWPMALTDHSVIWAASKENVGWLADCKATNMIGYYNICGYASKSPNSLNTIGKAALRRIKEMEEEDEQDSGEEETDENGGGGKGGKGGDGAEDGKDRSHDGSEQAGNDAGEEQKESGGRQASDGGASGEPRDGRQASDGGESGQQRDGGQGGEQPDGQLPTSSYAAKASKGTTGTADIRFMPYSDDEDEEDEPLSPPPIDLSKVRPGQIYFVDFPPRVKWPKRESYASWHRKASGADVDFVLKKVEDSINYPDTQEFHGSHPAIIFSGSELCKRVGIRRCDQRTVHVMPLTSTHVDVPRAYHEILSLPPLLLILDRDMPEYRSLALTDQTMPVDVRRLRQLLHNKIPPRRELPNPMESCSEAELRVLFHRYPCMQKLLNDYYEKAEEEAKKPGGSKDAGEQERVEGSRKEEKEEGAAGVGEPAGEGDSDGEYTLVLGRKKKGQKKIVHQ